MNAHDELIRNTRLMAGLPVEDTSEEVIVIQKRRDAKFAMSEARDLAGLHDYQPSRIQERFSLSFAVQMGDDARKMGESLARLSAHTDHDEIAAAAASASKALKALYAVTAKAKKTR